MNSGGIKHVLCLFGLWAFCVFAGADEALVKESGGCISMMGQEHPTIRMASADITMTCEDKQYKVDCTFVFENSGPEQTVTVGFPKVGYGYFPDFKGSLKRCYRSWVDDVEVDMRDMPGSLEDRVDGTEKREVKLDTVEAINGFWKNLHRIKGVYHFIIERRWCTKEVKFRTGTTTTRVAYEADYGHTAEDAPWSEYYYGTGSTWKGEIGSLKLRLRCEPEIWVLKWPEKDRKYKLQRVAEREWVLDYGAVEPAKDEMLSVMLTHTYLPFYDFGDFEYSDKEIPADILEMLTDKQLDLLKDFILASAGKPGMMLPEFDKYTPRDGFTMESMTEVQKRNLSLVEVYKERLKKLRESGGTQEKK